MSRREWRSSVASSTGIANCFNLVAARAEPVGGHQALLRIASISRQGLVDRCSSRSCCAGTRPVLDQVSAQRFRFLQDPACIAAITASRVTKSICAARTPKSKLPSSLIHYVMLLNTTYFYFMWIDLDSPHLERPRISSPPWVSGPVFAGPADKNGGSRNGQGRSAGPGERTSPPTCDFLVLARRNGVAFLPPGHATDRRPPS